MPETILEICVESLPEAVAAVRAGAQRLEVCGAMSEAGITPSIGLVEAILASTPIPVFVMVRPRGGDFVFDEVEVDVMLRDIAAIRRAGASGIVTGALEASGSIDREATTRLVEAAGPLPVTFHRAFDLTANLEFSLDVLKSIGVRRVLTSGGASTALVGADLIARLVSRGGNAVTIVAGGSVRADCVRELVERTGVHEVHARPTRAQPVRRPGNTDVKFGPAVLPADHLVIDADAVEALASALQGG